MSRVFMDALAAALKSWEKELTTALAQLDTPPGLHWRCPRCLVRYPLPDYVCKGGWPHYDPQAGPGHHTPRHAPQLVERIPE